MKKKILIVVLATSLLFTTGCTNKKKQQEKNNKANEQISTMKVKDKLVFDDMMVLDDNTLQTEIGLRSDYFSNYLIGVSNRSRTGLYIAVKVKKDYKEKVEKLINNYISAMQIYLEDSKKNADEATIKDIDKRIDMYKNVYKEDYKGYNIYIASTEKDKVLEVLKDNIK